MDIRSFLSEGKCPLCFSEASIRLEPEYDGFWINCEACGQFIIDLGVAEEISNTFNKLHSCLYYYLTQQKETNEVESIIPLFYTGEKIDGNILTPLNHLYIKHIHISSILQLYPNTISDKISMTMINLGSRVKYIGNTCYIDSKRLMKSNYSLFFIDEANGLNSIPKQINGMLDILVSKGLIKESSNVTESIDITSDGWLMIEEYQKANQNLDQGFIAMWFDDKMMGARTAIVEAIIESGYAPMIIDMKEHNNQIVPEILFEIKRSEFVVADFTGGRGGVYYEAGYAHGLNKEVISCCREDDFDNLHFDLKQKSAIVWTNEADLKERLKTRIEATVGIKKK